METCLFCRKEYAGVGSDAATARVVTTSICPDCLREMKQRRPRSMHGFLDSLGVPILLIGSEPMVETANTHARKLLGKELWEIERHRGGDVIECVYARSPGGCGNDVHCRSCTIRNTVLDTFATGRCFERIRAYPDIEFGQEIRHMCFEISTEKFGIFVLLRIDNVRDVGRPRAHATSP